MEVKNKDLQGFALASREKSWSLKWALKTHLADLRICKSTKTHAVTALYIHYRTQERFFDNLSGLRPATDLNPSLPC